MERWLPPRGGGGVYSHLNDTSCAKNAHAQKFSQTTPQNANNARNGLINPQDNDPVVFTTDYGLEIKYANALTNSNLKGYTYFSTTGTGGTYLWVIIGYNSSLGSWIVDAQTEVGISKYSYTTQGNSYLNTIDNSPAGFAIMEDLCVISSLAKPNNEILENCVLCLASDIVMYGECRATSGPTYGDQGLGDLTTRSACTLESLGLSFLTNKIIPATTSNLTLFSMYGSGSSFNITKYLTADQRKLSSTYWSGDNQGYINTSGNYGAFSLIGTYTYGIRPAFVLNIG